MNEKKYVQARIEGSKQVRLTIPADTLRLAKSKAASQEISLSYAVANILQQWLRGEVKIRNGEGT